MERIHTDQAPAALGPYSQAIAADKLIFTSGQIGIDPETGTLKEGIAAQSEQVMKNLEAVLDAAGTDFDHVVKTTCFLADIADFQTFNEIYGRFICNAPARSCVAVKEMPKGALVEVECIALKH